MLNRTGHYESASIATWINGLLTMVAQSMSTGISGQPIVMISAYWRVVATAATVSGADRVASFSTAAGADCQPLSWISGVSVAICCEYLMSLGSV